MTLPIPVLDDRSFDQLVQEALARVPVHTPEWSNLNESDPGVTLLELFAFLTENLLYRSNRIPEANRLKFLSMLGIALQPPSPGTGLVTVGNDKGPLAPPLPLPAGTELRAGQVPFTTSTPLAVLPVTSALYYKQPQTALDAATRSRYQLLYQTFLETDSDVLTFYKPVALDPPATGKPDPVVDLGDPVNGTVDRSLWVALLAPKNADLDAVRRAIAGQSLSIGVYPATRVAGQVLPPRRTGNQAVDPGLVFEIAAPEPDPSGRSGPGFGVGPARYTRLPVTYAEPVLDRPGLVQVTLPPYEHLLLWDFDPEEEGTGDFPPRVDDAAVAARLVTWIRLRYEPTAAGTDPGTGTGSDCGCGCGSSATGSSTTTSATTTSSTTTLAALSAATGGPTGRITWAGVNATRAVQSVTIPAERVGTGTGTPFQTFTLARTPVLGDDAPGGLTVEVQDTDGTWHAWSEIDDIYAAGPDDTVFTLERATGKLLFGNGLTGRRPARGAAIRASYSSGGGLQGQVAIGGINRSAALPGGFGLTNPVPTWGAGDGESTADGESAVTRWLRHRDRLVTADDFRDLTRRTPGVDLGRVEVLPLFNPDRPDEPQDWAGMVTVLVIPRSDPLRPTAPLPDRQFLGAVCGWLDPRRLITTELHVRGPEYQPIRVSVGIVTLPGQVPSIVEQAVTRAVETYLSPLTGGLPATAGDDDGLIAAAATTGTGWPLGVDVRPQDIEAIATRVPGVRYVDSVLIAMTDADGSVVSPVDAVPISGLRLPAATVTVVSGPAPDPAALTGGSQPVPPTQVPVPVVPDTC
ncbi:putative baseplate assembly protein [Streptomyces sp. NPDC056660]|uniref:putative baseplate assembly protein n=1 Tax=Streptomyces sp. NPDC056660 TaxID=3345897 RepID=UPI0036C2AA38